MRHGSKKSCPSGILLTTVEKVAGYARKALAVAGDVRSGLLRDRDDGHRRPRFDIARFGMEVFRATPRQADLMIVAGRVSQKMAPVLRQIYDQMPEPKWVLAMGVCASVGGMFNNYAIVQGVDHVVPGRHVPAGLPAAAGDAARRDPQAARQDPHQPLGVKPREAAIRRGRASRRCAVAADDRDDRACCGERASSDEPTAGAATARGPADGRDRRRGDGDGARAASAVARHGMFGASGYGDTSGYGGLVRAVGCPAAAPRPYGGYFDEVADDARERAGAGCFADAIERVVVDRGELTLHVQPRAPARRWRRPCATTRRCASSCASACRGVALPRRRPAASCTPSTTCCR